MVRCAQVLWVSTKSAKSKGKVFTNLRIKRLGGGEISSSKLHRIVAIIRDNGVGEHLRAASSDSFSINGKRFKRVINETDIGGSRLCLSSLDQIIV